ncbi:glycosyltransferase family 1 protein, partial [Micromonospora chalcea]
FPHGDPDALAGAVDRLLADEVFARRVARRARTMVTQRYAWSAIAARTAGSYAAARRDHDGFQARRATALLARDRSAITIPEGNLLAGTAS